ncbi:hypothetical protein [Treponema bryantii]|uniref:hypothetical protein n=1 Tax=Treponema bryantii TaxID=163 RepID=UPI0003B3226F|nr:hypothetical protein [Treponema bryantii]
MEYLMNDAIKSYCEFLEKYFKNPNDFTVKASVQLINAYYNYYKNFKYTENLSHLIAESRNDLEIDFSEKEQVWAFIHLMIESIEGQTLNIFNKRQWIYCMKKFQHGMSKLWVTKHERKTRTIVL